VVEGWYGQPFAKPLARTREYIAILRDIFAREDRVTAPGPHYPLPIRAGPGWASR
jgi:alkanesulfonate monooxygenase SsuD/methylene tetrahydromethanopterin reductase-like flavin-dependent oxidoreductase (luciferase family)